jgi:hypothetical protein
VALDSEGLKRNLRGFRMQVDQEDEIHRVQRRPEEAQLR